MFLSTFTWHPTLWICLFTKYLWLRAFTCPYCYFHWVLLYITLCVCLLGVCHPFCMFVGFFCHPFFTEPQISNYQVILVHALVPACGRLCTALEAHVVSRAFGDSLKCTSKYCTSTWHGLLYIKVNILLHDIQPILWRHKCIKKVSPWLQVTW